MLRRKQGKAPPASRKDAGCNGAKRIAERCPAEARAGREWRKGAGPGRCESSGEQRGTAPERTTRVLAGKRSGAPEERHGAFFDPKKPSEAKNGPWRPGVMLAGKRGRIPLFLFSGPQACTDAGFYRKIIYSSDLLKPMRTRLCCSSSCCLACSNCLRYSKMTINWLS
jgi:hypothetical protein